MPENLEGAVQSLLSPKGWIGGPPRIVTWNTAGAYCVVSESGEAWSCHIPDECRSLKNSWDSRKMDKMLAEHKVQVSEHLHQNTHLVGCQSANKHTRPFHSAYLTRITTFSCIQIITAPMATTYPKIVKRYAKYSMFRHQNMFARPARRIAMR